MNSPPAPSPAAAASAAGPAARSAIHGTDTLVPSLDGDYQRGVSALWRVLRMALRYRVRFPAAVLAVIVAAVFQLLIPRYLGSAIDQALGLLPAAQAAGGATAAQAALVTSALLVLGIAVMRGLFTLAHNYLAESIGQSFGYELRLRFFEKLQRFTRISPHQVRWQVTVDDPSTWTKPWTFALPLTVDHTPLPAYECHEGNYGLRNILSAARAEEWEK